MPTLSKQSEFLFRCDHAKENLGISSTDYKRLSRLNKLIKSWIEEECNGTIQWAEDEDFNPTYPYHFNPLTGERSKPIQDRYSKYLRECENILEKYKSNDLKLYLQGDPRGCHVWIYRAADDPKNRISSNYNVIGIACYE
tara:strand:- start:648 stop:1067 length:420 start_codon:yes stop_codon:yes gene_type:complete